MTKVNDKDRAMILLKEGVIVDYSIKGHSTVYIIKAFGQTWQVTMSTKTAKVKQIFGGGYGEE